MFSDEKTHILQFCFRFEDEKQVIKSNSVKVLRAADRLPKQIVVTGLRFRGEVNLPKESWLSFEFEGEEHAPREGASDEYAVFDTDSDMHYISRASANKMQMFELYAGYGFGEIIETMNAEKKLPKDIFNDVYEESGLTDPFRAWQTKNEDGSINITKEEKPHFLKPIEQNLSACKELLNDFEVHVNLKYVGKARADLGYALIEVKYKEYQGAAVFTKR